MGVVFVPGDLEAAMAVARAAAPDYARQLGLGPLEELSPRFVMVDMPGSVHTDLVVTIRYDRTYAGVPVHAGNFVVHARLNGEIGRVSGDTTPIILDTVIPSVSAEEAQRLACAATAIAEAEARPAELIITGPGPATPPLLAWSVVVNPSGVPKGTPESRIVDLDAQTGAVLVIGPAVLTAAATNPTIGVAAIESLADWD